MNLDTYITSPKHIANGTGAWSGTLAELLDARWFYDGNGDTVIIGRMVDDGRLDVDPETEDLRMHDIANLITVEDLAEVLDDPGVYTGPRPVDPPETHEIDAWLGDTTLTDEQRNIFDDEVAEIFAAYPDPDDSAQRDDAMSVAVQLLVGDTTPADIAQRVVAAETELAEARAAARTAARVLVATGTSESETARLLDMNRGTIRAALGK